MSIVFRQKLKNESGMAMLVVLIMAFISSWLASSYMTVVVSESRHSVWQEHRTQSLFLAEAGLEMALHLLNNPDDPDNTWVDETGQILDLPLPLEYSKSMTDGYYEVTLYSKAHKTWLPEGAYLVESLATIPRLNGEGIKRGVSCVVDQLDDLEIRAALSILDYEDLQDELIQFDSVNWTVDGTDRNDDSETNKRGLPGIAIANDGDEPLRQLGLRVNQVTGADEDGNSFVGSDAILEDSTLPKNLEKYVNYFTDIAIKVSGVANIPKELLGTAGKPQVLYADLSQGPIRILPNQPGYGVMVLSGKGDFSIEGGAEWHGVIICAEDSEINLNGGGVSAAHIYGALLISNGTVTMNGTADIVYSSKNIADIGKLLLYQVYSWCDSWGTPLGSDEYDPVTDETTTYTVDIEW